MNTAVCKSSSSSHTRTARPQQSVPETCQEEHATTVSAGTIHLKKMCKIQTAHPFAVSHNAMHLTFNF